MAGPTHASSGSRGRLYQHPVTAETAVSVTTILGDGIPKKALVGWAAKEAASYAVDNIDELAELAQKGGEHRLEAIDRIKGSPWRRRDNKANMGTAVHDIAERMGLEGPGAIDVASYDPDLQGYVRSLVRWWEAWKPEVQMTEATVWSREWGYAGTLDLIAKIEIPGHGEVTALIDYKSSKGVYGETALQLIGYANADFVLLDDGSEAEMPKTDIGGVVHILPSGQMAPFYPVQLTDELWSTFLYVREVALWTREGQKHAIGKAAAPAGEANAPGNSGLNEPQHAAVPGKRPGSPRQTKTQNGA